VANKESDYDQTGILQFNLLMDPVWKSAEIMKNETALQESEKRRFEMDHWTRQAGRLGRQRQSYQDGESAHRTGSQAQTFLNLLEPFSDPR